MTARSATRHAILSSLVNVNYMKLVYVRGLEEDGAKFWLKRVGWEPSEVARKIAQENDPEETSLAADTGGATDAKLYGLRNKVFSRF
jgi:hypothetical protein